MVYSGRPPDTSYLDRAVQSLDEISLLLRRDRCTVRAQSGFSLPELMIAITIPIVIMAIAFQVMRQNQNIFTTETGVTNMDENVRAAVDLMTREVQAAGTG